MVNYSRTNEKKSLKIRNNTLAANKGKLSINFLLLLAIIPVLLFCPIQASAADKKVAVLPFKIEPAESAGNLNTFLQEIFSQQLTKMGYQVISNEMVNAILGDNVSFSDPEKNIIPFAKTNNADWVVMGEITEKDGSMQLDVKVLDTATAKTPFSVMMVAKDREALPESVKKIAESLGGQIKNNIIISDIIVKGSKRASEDAILNIIESQKGDQFNPDKLDRDLRIIYRMGFFEDVNYDLTDTPDGRIITFNLVEKPTIIKITFEGNKYKKEDKLNEELGIRKYSVLNRNEVKQSVNRLLEFYRNDGYYNVEIKAQIKDLQDENEVILNYVIKEGEKVYITKIQFKGNKIFDDDDLQDIMLTKEKGWLTWFTDSGVLDKNKLDFDLQRIRIFYDNHGYIKAQVGAPEIVYDEKKDGLILTINIVEGEQYMVNDVFIEGDLLRPAEVLRTLLPIKKDDPFSRQVIYTEKQNILDLYADLGYAYAEATPSSQEIEGTNLVNVTLNIKKNKRVRIERINIYGNEITQDKVLRRELLLAEGDYFSRIRLERSKERLERIEIFDNQEAKIRNGSTDDLMVIDIGGEEKLRRSISFSAGYGGYEKFMFQLQYANNNLFGRGQNFEIDALLGGTTTRFNATITEPWLFDKPVRGTLTGFKWDMDYDEYTRKRVGGAGGLGFLLGIDDYTRGTFSYSFDRSEITDIYSTAAAEIWAYAGVTVTSSATIGIERNSKNKWWDTSKGSLNYFTYEYAGGLLGGDSAFNKYIASSTFYFPIYKKTVFVINAEVGLVQGRSGGSLNLCKESGISCGLPIYERFLLGGIDSVRGYEWGSISPTINGSQLGGTRKWLYKLEYRVPLVKGEGLTGLVFFDAGNAYDSDQSWKDGAGMSVGFGIRWDSPMGPLRLEYGHKLKDNPNDTDSGRFEFKISGSY